MDYTCGGLNKNSPIGSYIGMLSHQGVELFDRIKRIRRCGLVGGSVSLGVSFEVSKAQGS